jgi:tetratricopeptide (TPR) repeat protein
MRNLTKAREELNILTFLDENNSDRWEKLISFDFSTQQNELVIVNAKIATEKFKEKSIFYLLQAFAYDELSLIDSSITILTEATKNVFDIKEKSEIFGSLGDMHYKNNDNRKAFKSYDEALVIDPLNARVLNNYSYYLSLINSNLSKALKMSSKAVELDPNNSTYIDTKGWVLFKMERFEEAKEVLRNAIAKSGTHSAVINEHYGDVLFRVGNKDNAYIYWLKAKEIGGGSDKLEEKIKTKTYVP